MVIYIFTLLGVFSAAVSGALAAGRKDYDWVGMAVVAGVTALGGGTIRDMLLNRPHMFWVEDPTHIWTIIAACLATLLYMQSITKVHRRLVLITDAGGLALFSLSGAQIAERCGAPPIVIILMGVITGAGGGVLRDILTKETPVLFSPNEPLYSFAALFGISAYLILQNLSVDQTLAFTVGMIGVAAVRLVAIFWNIRLPVVSIRD